MNTPRFSVDSIEQFIKKNNKFYILGTEFEAKRIKNKLISEGKRVEGFIDLSSKYLGKKIDGVDVFSLETYLEQNNPLIVASLQDIYSDNWEVDATNLLIKKYEKVPFVDFIPIMGYFLGMEHLSRYKQLIGKDFYDYYTSNKSLFDQALNCLEDSYSKDIYQKVIEYKLMCLDVDSVDINELLIVSKDEAIKNDIKSKEVFDTLSFVENDNLRSMISSHMAVDSYSYKEIINPSNKKCILDIGAYNGDTAAMFSILSPDSKVYAFEPVSELNEQIELTTKSFENIEVVKKGAWNKTTVLKFNTLRRDNYIGVGSFVSEDGTDQIDVVAIDDFIHEKEIKTVDFIKMDIEGAEVNALKGAYNTILRDKPDLAICIYHEPSDLWEIPLWIKENFPEYKIYIDHKYIHPVETVCYATVN